VRTGVLGYGTVEVKKERGEPIWPLRLKIRVEKVFREPKRKPAKMLVGFPINKLDPETYEKISEDE